MDPQLRSVPAVYQSHAADDALCAVVAAGRVQGTLRRVFGRAWCALKHAGRSVWHGRARGGEGG